MVEDDASGDAKDPPPSSGGGEALPGPWAKTYAARSRGDLLAAYSEWAPTYDVDSVERFGYVAPERAARVLSDRLRETGRPSPKDCRILDVGAGTGLVGEELRRLGHGNVVGWDCSPDMLRVAEAKACYAELHCVDLCDSADALRTSTGIETGSFDAAISVGTFTPHHLGIDALSTAIAFLRSPGGLLVLSLRDDFVDDGSNGFRAGLEALEASGRLRRVGVTDPELYTREVSRSITFRCWVFTVL